MKLNSLKYFSFFLIFVPKLVMANDIDVTKKKLLIILQKSKTLNDSIETYGKLIYLFCNTSLDSSIIYYNKTLPLLSRSNNAKLKAKVYENIAHSYWYSNNFKNAMDFYVKEQRIGDSLNDKKIIADSKYNIGWIKTLQLKQYQYVNYFYE